MVVLINRNIGPEKQYEKLVAILLLVIMVFSCSFSLAEGDKFGKEYTIDGECILKVKSAKPYDVFFNEDSLSGKTWIAVSFDLLNPRTDPFYVKTATGARVVYDGDFDFSPDFFGLIRKELI